MDKCLTYLKNLYKEGKISQLLLDLDSEYMPKCSFVLESRYTKDERSFIWRFNGTCSNYRLQITTDPIPKEVQAQMEEVYSQFVQRENKNRCCSWLSNKWENPDVLLVEEAINFLLDPLNKPKIPLMKRSVSMNKF